MGNARKKANKNTLNIYGPLSNEKYKKKIYKYMKVNKL